MTSFRPFRRILGSALDQLPQPVRTLHDLNEHTVTSGTATITAASNAAAWLLCRLAGLPAAGRDVPVSVAFEPDQFGREHWRRRFAGRRYASIMEAGNGADAGLLIEHFGPFDLLFRLEPVERGLGWSLVGWRLLRIPLPAWTRPTIECTETADGEDFVFDIDVAFPIIGHVTHYRGWLRRSLGS